MRSPTVRAALALILFTFWLALLFAGFAFGGGVHLLLAAALALFPWKALTTVLCLVALLLAGSAEAAPPRTEGRAHDRSFWRGIVEKGNAVPAGESAAALVRELSGYVGSPDPELRDTFSYGLTAEWIGKGRLAPADLRGLVRTWTANLRSGLGESGTDSVFRRSFSALNLATIAAYENEKPFLQPAEVRSLLDAALAYLAAEKDLRGYDPKKGWIHATAHTADLLAALAANRHLRKADHARLLDAFGARLDSAGMVFAWGEDEPVAEAMRALIQRKDFQARTLDPWLARLEAEKERLWQGEGGRVDPRLFAAVQNRKSVLKSLAVALANRGMLSPEATKARAKVLAALREP
jgi:hypothetical protein